MSQPRIANRKQTPTVLAIRPATANWLADAADCQSHAIACSFVAPPWIVTIDSIDNNAKEKANQERMVQAVAMWFMAALASACRMIDFADSLGSVATR